MSHDIVSQILSIHLYPNRKPDREQGRVSIFHVFSLAFRQCSDDDSKRCQQMLNICHYMIHGQ